MSRKSLTSAQRVRIFDAGAGLCHFCGCKIHAERGEAWDVSHVIPLEAGGPDELHNMQPAHRTCHRKHTAEIDAPRIAKTKRQRQKHLGIRHPTVRPLPGSRASGIRKRMSGEVERWPI
jgi:5-methylcytosine-specific restriction protein A